jgi:hypothetical protein
MTLSSKVSCGRALANIPLTPTPTHTLYPTTTNANHNPASSHEKKRARNFSKYKLFRAWVGIVFGPRELGVSLWWSVLVSLVGRDCNKGTECHWLIRLEFTFHELKRLPSRDQRSLERGRNVLDIYSFKV